MSHLLSFNRFCDSDQIRDSGMREAV